MYRINILFYIPPQECISYDIAYFSDYKVGDIVALSSVIDDVKKSFLRNGVWAQILYDYYEEDNKMLDMLGKQYPVLDVLTSNDVMSIVALPSPDGSHNSKWYFPASAIRVISKQGNAWQI